MAIVMDERQLQSVAVPGWRARARRFQPALPWLLLALLLIFGFFTVLTQADRYGMNLDEPVRELYGKQALAWYLSYGQDISFTQDPPSMYLPEHGGLPDVIVAFFQEALPSVDPWLVRHTVTGLIGWLGIIAIALCGYELGGPWLAFAAGLGLWLYPRYYGDIYANPKDIPAAVAMTFVLWATMQLPKYWPDRWRTFEVSTLLGILLGIATAIRVTSLMWVGILGLIAAWWWRTHRAEVRQAGRAMIELRRQCAVAGMIGVSWFITTVMLWPWVFLNPIRNLLESAYVMGHYPWGGTTLFNGHNLHGSQIPWDYTVVWLVIGSPPLTLLLAAGGTAIALREMSRSRRINPSLALVILAFFVQIAPLVLLHPVLYSGLRQFLFLIPPLILLAAYGLVRGARLLLAQRRPAPRWLAVALLVVTVVSYAMVAGEMVELSPYEYTYFSPVIGGLPGAENLYDTEYYGTCTKAAVEWLNQNYQQYDSSLLPSVDDNSLLHTLIPVYLSPSIAITSADPDFVVAYSRYNDFKRYSGYQVIHTVAVEGVTFCEVKVNPARLPAPPGP